MGFNYSGAINLRNRQHYSLAISVASVFTVLVIILSLYFNDGSSRLTILVVILPIVFFAVALLVANKTSLIATVKDDCIIIKGRQYQRPQLTNIIHNEQRMQLEFSDGAMLMIDPKILGQDHFTAFRDFVENQF